MNDPRAPVPADAETVARLRSRHAPDPVSEEGVRVEWSAPGFDLERDARMSDAGYAAVFELDATRTWIELHGEHPEELLAWAFDRAPAGRLFSGSWESDATVKRAVETAGFRLIRHSYRMAIDLIDVSPPPPLPGGLELRSFRPGDERDVYETHMETFEDSWEHVHEPYERWLHMMVELPDFDPGLWLLAIDGPRIAGIALSIVREHQPDTGRIMIIGVRREWRRRGLGEALLRASFAQLAARACSRAILGVDAESLTGAHRLYERAGMHVAARFDFYEKPA